MAEVSAVPCFRSTQVGRAALVGGQRDAPHLRLEHGALLGRPCAGVRLCRRRGPSGGSGPISLPSSIGRGWPKPGAAHGLILPLRGPVGGGSARSERRLVLRTGVQPLLVRHRLQQPHRDGGLPVGVRRPRPTPCLKPSTLLYSDPNSPRPAAHASPRHAHAGYCYR